MYDARVRPSTTRAFRRAAIMTVLVAAAATAAAQSTLVDRTVAGDRLTMDVTAANVVIERWDESGIHVLAVQRGGREGDFRVELIERDGAVIVRDEVRPRIADVSLTYTVRVPAETPVVVDLGSGNVDVVGVRGGLVLDVRSGNVDLRQVGGAIDVQVASGNVDIADAIATATIYTRSGNVRATATDGSLDLTAGSGNVTVVDARDAVVTAQANSGNVEFSGVLRSGGRNVIDVRSGNVTVLLPTDADVSIDAHTRSGSVTSDLPLERSASTRTGLTGTLGDGGATLAIDVGSGNVRLLRR